MWYLRSSVRSECREIRTIPAKPTSSIASTMQQMSISFGVASAGLATAFFVPRVRSNPAEMIHGVHEALVVLGGFTILSTVIFSKLKSGDGQNVSQQKVVHAE